MGGKTTVTLYADSEAKAQEAARVAFARFAQLEDVMSDYRPSSELMRLCKSPAGQWVKISKDLERVLRQSQRVSALTGGAFDITAGPLVRLWREARRGVTLPWPSQVAAARALVGPELLQLRPGEARLAKAGMQLDLGGIAKGDACDQALIALAKTGVTAAMIEAGGDIASLGCPPEAKGWEVQIVNGPKVFLKDQALSTSGGSEQFFEFRGAKYAHIVDPRTGYGVPESRQASVIARRGLDTDPFATAFCILPKAEAMSVAKQAGLRLVLP